jgi:alpha-glucosidase
MATFAWWQRGVIYQIYPRSFNDSNNDGIGDLQGILSKLDYLNTLGIDAIWISPFYPSPMADFGYDVANYTDVDPMFGDLATFDKLVAEAHKRNIKVIIDYVPNHSSNQHPWFLESRSSRDNPKRDWYIWKDAKPDGSLPNDWDSMFGGAAWTWDEVAKQYYFHQFAPEQPDLNWRNPEVRQAMLDVLRFWLKRGVDGFRMDVVYMIWKHPDMPDHFPANPSSQPTTQNPAYNYPGIHDVLADMRAIMDEYNAIGIAEVWLPVAERNAYFAAFEMPFNFDFLGYGERNKWDAAFFRDTVNTYDSQLPEGEWGNYVLGSHDVQRLASRYGSEARARVAAMLLLTLRGTPTLYNGDELGMVNGDIQEHEVQDPQGKNLGVAMTRDVCRTPFQWDNTPYGGFSKVETWLPVNDDYPTRNVAVMEQDEKSILNLYRQLIAYRKAHESLAIGSYEALESPEGTFVYLRQYGDEKHLIALNFTSEAKTITLPFAGTIVLSTGLDRQGAVDKNVTVNADEGIVIRLA